jgi:uncharacterized protein (DUF302 family)
MEKIQYGFRKALKITYEEAVEKVTQSLKKEGFGILTQIDVKDTLKKKLNVDFRKYVILGACNPSFAHQSLQAETEIGLLLPCNVIVYEDNSGHTFVSAINPESAMAMIDNPKLKQIATQVSAKLEAAIESL